MSFPICTSIHPVWRRCSSFPYQGVCAVLAPCQTSVSAPKQENSFLREPLASPTIGSMTTRVRRRLLMSGGLALVVGGLLTAAYLFTFFSTTQIRSTDFLFKSRTDEHARSTVIVGIDQRSYRTLLPKHGAMTNWPRTLYADVVHALQHAGARVVAFDIFFDAPRPEDSTLASVFQQAGNIILPVEAQGPGTPKPHPGVAQEFEVFFRSTETIRGSAAAEGFVNVTTDPDTVILGVDLVAKVNV